MKFNKVALIVFLLSPGLALSQSDFQFKRKINSTQAGWHAIPIPTDLYAHCQSDFQDLRLYQFNDRDTIEIPYIIKTYAPTVSEQQIKLKLINESRKGNQYYLTFTNNQAELNSIRLDFMETNYVAKITIQGSEDRKQWVDVGEPQTVFAVKNDRDNYESNVLTIPLSDFAAFKIVIESDKPLHFRDAFFSKTVAVPGTMEAVEASFKPFSSKKEKQTQIEVQLKHFGPVSQFEIMFEDGKDFYRSAILETLVDSVKTEKGWIMNYASVANSYVTSFKRNLFDFDRVLTSKLRLTIYNADNAPLATRNVRLAAAKTNIIAELPRGEIHLFYGSKRLTSPSYDILHFQEKIPTEPMLASMGNEERLNNLQVAKSPIFENKAWLWVVMIGVIGLLGFFTIRMMSSKPQA